MTPTPPPMSEQAIADMAKQIGWDSTEDGLHADVLALVARAIAARDEQWRQRLEVAAIDGAGIPHTLIEGEDLGPQDTPLYRTKEQVQCNAKN